VKPERHVTAVADLNDAEAAELGALLRLTARVAALLVGADQVYTCLWSHAGAVPGHVHYVVQPVTAEQVAETGLYGPALQMKMFRDNRMPTESGVAEVAERARVLFIDVSRSKSWSSPDGQVSEMTEYSGGWSG
jgi:diadenosine tetraphosphate (Ap4A) HIT family hydrolase